MRVPVKIGRYEIMQQLGQGGMAVVYLARDPLMDRHVAVKLLPRQFTFNQALRARFQKEARIVASLEHPAIVPVHDFGEFNEQPYLVMRYMVGGSLAQQLQDGPLSLMETVRIIEPLAQALDKAHEQHVIHRDLKPDNILFDGDKNPYLSDFGIARLAEGTQTTSIMGTPAYMSPEQITGEAALDGRSDIYALGVILFQMLSGEQPYTGETPTQIMMKHVLEPIPMILEKNTDLPPATQLVIERAMAKNREERFATAEEMVEAVKGLLTASQAAEMRAAAKTMLELPEGEIDPFATVIEQRVPAAASSEIEREVQAAALYARLQAAVTAKDWVNALAVGAQLQRIDPAYRDVQAILDDAQAQLTIKDRAEYLAGQTAAADEAIQEEPAAVEKKTRSKGLQIAILGCTVVFLIFLCLTTIGVIGNYLWGREQATAAAEAATAEAATTEALAAARDVEDVPPTERVLASPTVVVTVEATVTPEPTSTVEMATTEPTPEPVELLPAGVLFEDNFDGKSSAANWDLWADESAEFTVSDGHMLATGYDDSTLSWVKQFNSYTDFEMSVTADILAGGRSAMFGFVLSGADDNYVGCFIQGDNSGYCGKRLDGETEFGDWVVIDLSVLRDDEILFVVHNNEWAMSINNQCAGSGSVDFGPEGQPALAVSTADSTETASIEYDDYLIRTPTEEGLSLLGCEPEYFE